MLDDGEAKAPPALHFHPSLIPGRVLGFGSLVVTEKFIKGYIRDRELGGPNGCRGRKGAADFSLDIRHLPNQMAGNSAIITSSLSGGTIRALRSSGLRVILLGGGNRKHSLELLRCLEI